MKILNKIIIKDLKLNKKRSIVTIIGIMLSVALICAVAGMFTSFRATLLKGVIESTGYYHIKIENVDEFHLEEDEAERLLIKIKKCKGTPKLYPRKAGTPTKNPL